MGKVTLAYGIRHKTFMKNARYNGAVAIFEPDGCFIGVATCDPDGVYVIGDIPPFPYEYVKGGAYEIEVPDEYVVRKIAYAYETRCGRKFVVPVEHSGNTFVSLRIGEYLQDKFKENPINLYLKTADSGMCLTSEDTIVNIVNDEIDLPLPLTGREVGKVYGVKNPKVAREIYRNAYHKGLVKEDPDCRSQVFYTGPFGLKFNEFGEFFITYLSYNHPEIIIRKTQSIREAIDTYNFIVSMYYAPSHIVVVRDEDPVILKEDKEKKKWITVIDPQAHKAVQFSIKEDGSTFFFWDLDTDEKALIEKALSLINSTACTS